MYLIIWNITYDEAKRLKVYEVLVLNILRTLPEMYEISDKRNYIKHNYKISKKFSKCIMQNNSNGF